MDLNKIVLKLHSIGAIKFGSYELKKDFIAPFHVDLRGVVSHPELAKGICNFIWEKAGHLQFDLVCGTPFLGGCLATYIAWSHDRPLIVKRPDMKEKEITAKIEGMYKSGQRSLLIQDLLISGGDTLDTLDDLKAEGVDVRDIVIFLDLEMGGRKKLKEAGFVPHILVSVSEVFQILSDANKIPGDAFKFVTDFMEGLKTHVKKPTTHS